MDMDLIRKYAGLNESAPAPQSKAKKTAVTVGKDAEAFTANGLYKYVSEKAASKFGTTGGKIAGSVVWKLMAEHGIELTDGEMNSLVNEADDHKFAMRFSGLSLAVKSPAEIVSKLVAEKLIAKGVTVDAATLNKLVEMSDEDDDLSPAEKALADKAESDLKKKGVKVKAFDPDKVVGKTDKDKEERAANNESPEKKEAPAKVADSEPAAEAKKRGRTPSETGKSGGSRGWMAKNPGATRGQFIAHATADLGMSKAHASTVYYLMKKKMNEGYVLSHPTSFKFVLGENKLTGNYVWGELDSDAEPAIFETEQAAQEIATFMVDYRSTVSVITKINLEEGMLDKIKQAASDVEDEIRGNFRPQGTRADVAKKAIVKAGSKIENKVRGIPE